MIEPKTEDGFDFPRCWAKSDNCKRYLGHAGLHSWEIREPPTRPTVKELNAEVKRAIESANHSLGLGIATDPIVVNGIRASLHSGDYELNRTDVLQDLVIGAVGRVMETVFSAYRSKTPEEFGNWLNDEIGAYR